MNKIRSTAVEALAEIISDGMVIMAGGFGLCGIPETLIEAERLSGRGDLTFISNNAASMISVSAGCSKRVRSAK